mgnify:CR=1 FL=1
MQIFRLKEAIALIESLMLYTINVVWGWSGLLMLVSVIFSNANICINSCQITHKVVCGLSDIC